MKLGFNGPVSLGLAIINILLLAGCARAPIPTSDQPTPAATFAPTATSTAAATVEPSPTLLPATAAPTATNFPTATTTPLPTSTPATYESTPRAILLEADVTGGLAPVPRELHVVKFRLYGDGLVVSAGDRAPLSTGLDAVVRTGYLSQPEIQRLLGYLNEIGFNNLDAFYQPRPVPADMETASITVYLNKAKTVRVYAPGLPGTPQAFSDALQRILKSVPADARPFMPSDGLLLALNAGSANDLKASSSAIKQWPPDAGVRLADVGDGFTISGATYTNVAGLIGRNYPAALYREGDRVYRVTLSPNLPRAVHLTDWVGPILEAPREFEGRAFDIAGYYRGANLYGEARGTPANRNDWVILDQGGAIFVSGLAPQGLDPASRGDAWTVVRLRAVVVYVRSGTSYLEARRVEVGATNLAATPTPLANLEAAVAAVKTRFPDMSKVAPAGPGMVGASTDVKSFERADGWDLVFWEGWGDCPAGCINNRYTYFSVKKDGRVQKVGEFSRIFNSASNSFDATGTALWGVPK